MRLWFVGGEWQCTEEEHITCKSTTNYNLASIFSNDVCGGVVT